ncbi:MAG TPA: class I SAM-dependent methyltransferase, partial [Planctomycetota bacterium]|nr:class I SAM-dependent methyltransferase [Planctomycetota bacterium]
ARVLDVGCAAGYFLRVVKQHGAEVFGVELSPSIAKEAIACLGPDRIHIGELDQAVTALHLEPGSFDLITLWDVIEHVPEPQPVLRQIRTLLAPGGHLLLETQNVASLWARLLGRRWHHYKHEEHLYHFTPATITRLLADCGFRVRELSAAYAGKYVSLAFIAERAGRLGRLPGLLFRPLRLLAHCNLYVNPRDEIIVVAEPDGR